MSTCPEIQGASLCDNGDKLRFTFALDCCNREALDWIATNGGYTSDIVMDVMINSISKRFGNQLPDTPIEFLSDNGSCYTAKETRAFSKQLNLENKTTKVRSPQSDGMAKSFVKTIKRDSIRVMPKPDREVALINLAVALRNTTMTGIHTVRWDIAHHVSIVVSAIH